MGGLPSRKNPILKKEPGQSGEPTVVQGGLDKGTASTWLYEWAVGPLDELTTEVDSPVF